MDTNLRGQQRRNRVTLYAISNSLFLSRPETDLLKMLLAYSNLSTERHFDDPEAGLVFNR